MIDDRSAKPMNDAPVARFLRLVRASKSAHLDKFWLMPEELRHYSLRGSTESDAPVPER